MSDVQYTLNRDITSYTYPPHMKHPEGFFGENFFKKWIPLWEKHLGKLSGKPNIIGIEIGTLHGDCAIFCADRICNGEGSMMYSIDINETEYSKNNLAPYIGKNIEFVKGYSYDILRSQKFAKQTADFIYIDGSHLAIDVLSDAVMAWSILKDGGILIFDDYGWGIHTANEKQKPKLAIDAFLSAYRGHYQVIETYWQVFLKKLHYEYSKEELEANYQ